MAKPTSVIVLALVDGGCGLVIAMSLPFAHFGGDRLAGVVFALVALSLMATAFGLLVQERWGWLLAMVFHSLVVAFGVLVLVAAVALAISNWGGRYGGSPSMLAVFFSVFGMLELVAVPRVNVLRKHRQAFSK